MNRSFLLILGLLLAGCVRPTPPPVSTAPLPAAWKHGGSIALDKWRRVDDPVLTDCLARISANHTVRESIARLKAARARHEGAQAAALPTGEDKFGVRRLQDGRWFGAFDLGQQAIATSWSYSSMASWEIDLWGAVAGMEAIAQSEAQAAAANLESARVSIAAEICEAVWERRAAQRSAERARKAIERRRVIVARTHTAVLGGVLTTDELEREKLAVLDAENRYDEAQRAEAEATARLAILLVTTQDQVPIDNGQNLPTWSGTPTVALPADVVRQRPDVQAAEMALVAAAAKVGVIEADLYPRLSLLGSISNEGPTLGKAFTWEGTSWSIGPSLRWRLLDRARIKADAAAAAAEVDAALAQYEGAIVRAANEVQIALHELMTAHLRVQRQQIQSALVQKRRDHLAELVSSGIRPLSQRDVADDDYWESREAEDAAQLAQLRFGIKVLRAIGSQALPGPIPLQ